MAQGLACAGGHGDHGAPLIVKNRSPASARIPVAQNPHSRAFNLRSADRDVARANRVIQIKTKCSIAARRHSAQLQGYDCVTIITPRASGTGSAPDTNSNGRKNRNIGPTRHNIENQVGRAARKIKGHIHWRSRTTVRVNNVEPVFWSSVAKRHLDVGGSFRPQ